MPKGVKAVVSSPRKMAADVFMGDYWTGQKDFQMMNVAEKEGIEVEGGIEEIQRIMREVKESLQ